MLANAYFSLYFKNFQFSIFKYPIQKYEIQELPMHMMFWNNIKAQKESTKKQLISSQDIYTKSFKCRKYCSQNMLSEICRLWLADIPMVCLFFQHI